MAFDSGSISSRLSEAIGDEPALIAELRTAFSESAARAFAELEVAKDREAWLAAAARLKGLAASFGASPLLRLADEALARERRHLPLLRRLRRAIRDI